MFVIGKTYILEGLIFCPDCLEDNKNLFTYVGLDEEGDYTFAGAVDQAKQYANDHNMKDPFWCSVNPS